MTAAANSDARKRLAEQQAAPVSFANRQSDTLRDILHAYFYSQSTVNQPERHAEAVAALVAEHYGAEVAAERERADAAEREREELRDHWYQDRDRALVAEAKIAAARAVLREYATSVNPAPYTSERALYERLEAALGGEATP